MIYITYYILNSTGRLEGALRPVRNHGGEKQNSEGIPDESVDAAMALADPAARRVLSVGSEYHRDVRA